MDGWREGEREFERGERKDGERLIENVKVREGLKEGGRS